MHVPATADIFNNAAYGLFILWKTNNTQRSYKRIETEEACANASTLNFKKFKIPD